MQAYVIFADAQARREYQEDAIAYSQRDCDEHKAELRKMGCEPVHKVYRCEGEYYDAKERFESK